MIELYMQNDVWMANYRKADSAARIFELFGTYDLPTSYTAKSTAERVLKAFQVLNDDKVVTPITCPASSRRGKCLPR